MFALSNLIAQCMFTDGVFNLMTGVSGCVYDACRIVFKVGLKKFI